MEAKALAQAGNNYANWNLSPFFPEFRGKDYLAFRGDCEKRIADLRVRAKALGPLREENLADWARLIVDGEEAAARFGHLGFYVYCLSSDDARNETIQTELGSLSELDAEAKKARVPVLAAFKAVDDATFNKLLARPELQGAEHALRRTRQAAIMTMDSELEDLAADLSVTGFSAWERLAEKIAGTLEFDLKRPDGSVERVPMAKKMSLLEDPDAAVRKATLDGSNAAWAQKEDSMAACLNGIVGTRLSLYKRRGVKHFLDMALFEGSITRATLDAMIGAIEKKRDVARRYLKLKAQFLGKEKLGFQDEVAPLPLPNPEPYPWATACRDIESALGRSYPKLAQFCRMAFDQRWIESEPRAGKAPGGYCGSSHLLGEPRIYMTYHDTLGDAQTLAHELGHAFHEWTMRDMRVMAREHPATLAETASTFVETLFSDAMLEDPATSPRDKALMLDARMQAGSIFLLNIPMRFYFDKAFHEERAEGEVSVSRMKQLMLAAQRESYGDALAEDELDPYFWASKGHFYMTGLSFYNFPYAFGYLFSLGLFARFKKEGPSFFAKYEELLRLTGSDTAEGVARRALGVDIEKEAFWLDSLALVEEDMKRFEEVIPGVLAATAKN
jgi:oligoendopeptidase F